MKSTRRRAAKLLLLPLLVSMLLSACTSVPLSTIWRLRNFDPLQANPAQVRIAIITDKAVKLEDDAVSLEFSFNSEHAEYNFNNSSLATITSNANVDELNQYVAGNQRITLFYLGPDAAHTMRLSQNRIKIIKENEIEGDGSFGINLRTGCFNGPKPEQLLANVYARFNPEQGYIKMIANLDLLEQIDPEQKTFWLECANGDSASSKPTSL